MAEGRKLSDFAVGNARPGGRSSVERVQEEMARRFETMVAAMPPELQQRVKVISGFRDAARQAQVNPGVTNSRHMHGMALDLGNDPAVLDWINQNPQHGLGFPLKHMANEQNHLEMLDERGGRAPIGGQYAADPGPGVKSGLRRFGIAEDNLPPVAPAVPAEVAPAEGDDKTALLTALMLQQQDSGGLGGLPGSLSQTLTQGLAPAPVQPQPIPGVLSGPLPLSRRLI